MLLTFREINALLQAAVDHFRRGARPAAILGIRPKLTADEVEALKRDLERRHIGLPTGKVKVI